MPYNMNLFADGRCRHNSPNGPITAAAVTMTNKYDHRTTWTRHLAASPQQSAHRAQLGAIILALEQAQIKAQTMHSHTQMYITINTNSKYVIGCMTEWCVKWMRNGFQNARGREVADRDLIEQALFLERSVLGKGTVDWVWLPRSQIGVVGAVVDGLLDEMEPGYEDPDSDAPFWPS